MCGIIGIVGREAVSERVLEGLRRLEYRGYDSAGIATLTEGGIDRRRAEGKIVNLANRLAEAPLPGILGIGHTRWATHGIPVERNAHPHATARVAIVHNGIIENDRELRAELQASGYVFESDTDTEVVAQLVTRYLDDGLSPEEAAAKTFPRLEGAFSLALIFTGEDGLMIGARLGTPLAVGYGTGEQEGEVYLASDAIALAPLTNRLSYLEDGDWVVLRNATAAIRRFDGTPVERTVKTVSLSAALVGKGQYRHFMQKEMFEQPEVIADTINAQVHPSLGQFTFHALPFDPKAVTRLTISACGTAYYAGLVGKTWFERLARLPVEVDIASEFRYRQPPLPEGGAGLVVSQSGETADTLEALRLMRQGGHPVLGLINVPESTIAREADAVIYTQAGVEIGVASTKAFTTQLTSLFALAVDFGQRRGTLAESQVDGFSQALRGVPAAVADVLKLDEQIEQLSKELAEARDALFLGRGLMFPIAMEGALKLKEISYIHAEGYPAGELKHGPIALIDEHMPVIVAAPPEPILFEKTISNMQEVAARGGRVILISDAEGLARGGHIAAHTLEVPRIDPMLAPILYSVPLQLLSYHVAVHRGTDVDQPRNLAKSVTVE